MNGMECGGIEKGVVVVKVLHEDLIIGYRTEL